MGVLRDLKGIHLVQRAIYKLRISKYLKIWFGGKKRWDVLAVTKSVTEMLEHREVSRKYLPHEKENMWLAMLKHWCLKLSKWKSICTVKWKFQQEKQTDMRLSDKFGNRMKIGGELGGYQSVKLTVKINRNTQKGKMVSLE